MYTIDDFEDLVYEMNWRCLANHHLDIGYFFYDNEKLKEKALAAFYHTFDCYYCIKDDNDKYIETDY